MASRTHQLILGLVARSVRERGYLVVSFDGDEKIIDSISLKTPPVVLRHRPDLIGMNPENGRLCIGEAKTVNDIQSERTKEQFQDYSNLQIGEDKLPCELIIGIPMSGENILIEVLTKLGILEYPNVAHICVPDELLE